MLGTMRITIGRGTVPEADDMVLSYGVDDLPEDGAAATAFVGEVLAAILAIPSTSKQQVQVSKLETFEFFAAEGGPATYVQGIGGDQSWGTAIGGTSGLIQLAVSKMVESPRGQTIGGRSYIGPMVNAVTTRPSTGFQDIAVRYLQAIHAGVLAGGGIPVVISKRLNNAPRPAPVGLPIIGYSTDDQWDVLRSRRLPPTTRRSYPVTF